MQEIKLGSFDTFVSGHTGAAPIVLADDADVAWDYECDALVVGFGAAGAATALEASEAGAKVILIDRFDGGGATAYSGGVFYAGGTRFQEQAGFQDSAANMYAYLSQENPPVSDATLRKFCDGSAGDVEWLLKHGVQFDAAATTEKVGYPPDGKFLYFSGNETVDRFSAHARPAPRGHRTVGTGFTGRYFFEALRKAVFSSNIKYLSHMRATRLIMDRSLRVIGLEVLAIPSVHHDAHQKLYRAVDPWILFNFSNVEKAKKEAELLEQNVGQPVRIKADFGVVIATGGFVNNVEMTRSILPLLAEAAPYIMRMGSMGCSGSGISLGLSAGAGLGKMDNFLTGRNLSPPSTLLRGIAINSSGNRFINEDAYLGAFGKAIVEQKDGKAWLIVDSRLMLSTITHCLRWRPGQFMYYYLPALLNIFLGGTKAGFSLKTLARKLGISLESLNKSMTDYNDAITQGKHDPAGKAAQHCRQTLAQAPYFAINFSLKNKYSFFQVLTLGGLRVDEGSGLVTADDGKAIAGLFAAGRAAVGLCSNGYMSGMSLADCIFSGRRAGRGLLSAAQAS